jgi:hypothetical protein
MADYYYAVPSRIASNSMAQYPEEQARAGAGAPPSHHQAPSVQPPLARATAAVGAPPPPPSSGGGHVDESGYKDFSQVPEENGDSTSKKNNEGNSKKKLAMNFPAKLFDFLSREEFSDMIVWSSHGRSWRVLKPREFEQQVLTEYFKHSNYNSFTRQVNGWGFRRISQGPDFNSYYHEMFLRGKPSLCRRMRRPSAADKKKAVTNNVAYDPDFRKMPPVGAVDPTTKQHEPLRDQEPLLREQDSGTADPATNAVTPSPSARIASSASGNEGPRTVYITRDQAAHLDDKRGIMPYHHPPPLYGMAGGMPRPQMGRSYNHPAHAFHNLQGSWEAYQMSAGPRMPLYFQQHHHHRQGQGWHNPQEDQQQQKKQAAIMGILESLKQQRMSSSSARYEGGNW